MDQGEFSHVLRHEKDYIREPKPDGYRGIHQIFSYNVEPRKRRAGAEQPWNGMRVEIQYRTLVQHSWATAVETIGLLTTNNPKFNQGNEDFIAFFRVCSELISRYYENTTASLPYLSKRELVDRFEVLDRETHIFNIFERVNAKVEDERFEKTSILIFYYSEIGDNNLVEVRSYESVNTAIRDYNDLEAKLAGEADVVLVKAEGKESMRSAYRNYFADTAEFIQFVREALIAFK